MGAHISSVQIRGSNRKKIEHMAKMLEVAKLVVGSGNPPSWLSETLLDWSFEVLSSHSIDTIKPTKAELWDTLWSAEDLAIRLSQILKSPFTSGFLSTYAGRDLEAFVDDGLTFLSEFTVHARQARNSPQLVQPNGKLNPGAGRPYLPGQLPAKYICAAVIAEVWAFFHDGEDPAASNGNAQAAAVTLWGSWLASDKGWGSDRPKGWRPYLGAACHPELQPLRKQVRRHLNIHATHAAQMLENTS
jgi:hypothetical protein